MKKIVAGALIYLLIGCMLTSYRWRTDQWSRGGPAVIFAVVAYPVIWPWAEFERLTTAMRERAFRRERRNEEVALLCPQGFDPLLRDGILAHRRDVPAAAYGDLLHAVRRARLDPQDPRAGFVLDQLALAATAMGDVARARADARALWERGAGDSAHAKSLKWRDLPSAWAAAAILRGAYALAPDDADLCREILDVYERVCAEEESAGRPFAVFALGTAFEACGMLDEALARYEEALQSGRLDLSMQALIRALPLAPDDAMRLELTRLFAASLASLEWWTDDHLRRSLQETGWGDYERLRWYHRNYEGVLVLGRHLQPLYPARSAGARRFDAALLASLSQSGLSGSGRSYEWWEELIVAAAPAFSSFAARLEMVERVLDVVLGLQERGQSGYTDMLGQEVREVYYRLYDETGDGRWLDSAVESQVRVRPGIRRHEKHLLGEIAFMRGEYRRHFDLAAQRYIEADCDYTTLPRGFVGRKMRTLAITVGGESCRYDQALEDYLLQLSGELYDHLGLGASQPVEKKVRAYEAGELSPPFGDFADADVHAIEPD